MNTPMRRCFRCKRELPATAEYFVKSKRNSLGLSTECKDCKRARSAIYNKQHYAANPDYHKQRVHRWLTQNKDHKREYDKSRRADKEWARQRDHGYYIKYRSKRLVYARGYRQKNPDKIKNQTRNRDRTITIRYRTRKRNLAVAFTAQDWRHCLAYWNNSCAVCGRPAGLWHTIAADHWIPINNPNCPGTIPTNMIPLCHGTDGCNNAKQDRDPVEWLTEKLGKRKARRKLAEIAAYFEWVKSQK